MRARANALNEALIANGEVELVSQFVKPLSQCVFSTAAASRDRQESPCLLNAFNLVGPEAQYETGSTRRMFRLPLHFAIAAMCCGMLGRALDEALTYTRQRAALGGVIADLQAVQFLLADVATDLEAARALSARATDAQLRKLGASLACAHAKEFATRAAFTRIADCMQVMGPLACRARCPSRDTLNAPRSRNIWTARLRFRMW